MLRRSIYLCAALSSAAFAAGAEAVRYFDLAQVRVLEGPFHRAQELDRRYLLALEPDRLLAGFRSEAGLEPKALKYPNWESSGLDGHTLGHYLTAAAQMWAATGDVELKRRLDYTVGELALCQEAQGNGYVGAVPRGRELWADVAAGNFDVQGFAIKEAWVPWYNVHKTFAGLRDAWLITGNTQARDVLVALADWCGATVGGLSEEKMHAMLRAEHGGMNEVLADVYAITGDEKYIALAQRFSHRAILDPLLQREDRLTGLHANTQIPKVIGFARIAELGGDPAWRDASAFFWETVAKRRSVAFGGNSVREHFNPPDDFSGMLESREGPETCNTYNMLRLSEQLFRAYPEARFGDFYERALYNHILSSQHPDHGGFVYFTPIRPQHYRVYSQPSQCFWCCVGSGIENHGKYGKFIYATTGVDDTLYLNLFVASELDWKARGIKVRQVTKFPDEAGTRLELSLSGPQRFALKVRHPAWVSGDGLTVQVNGRPLTIKSNPSTFATIEREWRDGDRVEIGLPMRTTLERLPDGSDYVAFVHGPIVLAAKTGEKDLDGLVAGDARMGHATPGPYRPLESAPMLVGDHAELASKLRPVKGRPLTFTAAEVIRPASFRGLELEPFFRVHDSRYVMYWRMASPDRYADVVAEIEEREKARIDLERRTVDRVIPGEQQPEVEHGYRGVDSNTGAYAGRTWRDAGGWFSYVLKPSGDGPFALQMTTFGHERGREFAIEVNGQEIAAANLRGDGGEQFVESVFPLSDDLVAKAPEGALTVRFVARPGSRVGAIYDVRLVRGAQP